MTTGELLKKEDFERAVSVEMQLLGILTEDAGAFHKIPFAVAVSDFAFKPHGAWFSCLVRRIERGDEVDLFIVADELANSGGVHPPGNTNWFDYINGAVVDAPSAANIEHYAKMVTKLSADRRSAVVGASILKVLDDKHAAHGDRLREAGNLLSSLEPPDDSSSLITLKSALTRSTEYVERRYASELKIAYPYGFTGLDEMTQGAHPGDLIIVAGRPSMGKTAFALCIAESFLQNGMAGLVVSIEMSAEQLASRMITSVGRIDAQRYRAGQLNDDDWDRLTHAIGKLHECPMMIDESSCASPSSIRRAARRMVSMHGKLNFIIVDYMQLMSPDTRGHQNKRADEITEISRNLKLIAKEFNVPVIALSQLNRNLEQRTNKRPVMSDLRESGAIEQDADLILFLYRDEVYDKDSQSKGMAEIIIGKQRNGPVGATHVAFMGSYSRFENLQRNF